MMLNKLNTVHACCDIAWRSVRGLVCALGLLWLATGTAFAAGAADRAVSAARQVSLKPSALASLAQHLVDADEQLRAEFARLALDELRDSYAHELEVSAEEPPADPARRAKLARWQRGTQDLIGQLDAVRDELMQGASVTLQVDAARQVIMLIGTRPVVVAAPSPSAEKEVERLVVEQFCAFHDCWFIDQEDSDSTVAGVWIFRQGNHPAYAVGPDLQCEFPTLEGRPRKERACFGLWQELERLAAAVEQAHEQGHVVEWTSLKLKPVADGASLVINQQGAYLRLSLLKLTRIGPYDWQRIVDWLRDRQYGRLQQLVIKDTERLLGE